MADWVMALDGGGTKTAVALASRAGEARVLPEAPGCNPQDGPGWEGVLSGCLARATPAGLAAAALGIPGRGEVPAHDAAVDALLARALPCPFEAMNDVALAHLGAFGGGHGVLVLAGTGSMAWARGPKGEARVGGWGDAFGDEGSAYDVGRRALQMVARSLDGRRTVDQAFTRSLQARLGMEGAFAPLSWLMGQAKPRAMVAGVARHVDDLAEDGDAQAQSLLFAASEELAYAARVAAARAGLGVPFSWVSAGGFFRSAILTGYVTRQLRGQPAAIPRLSTLGGGLLRAATLAGWDAGGASASGVDARLRAAP